MYADRVEAAAKTSIKDRLNGSTVDDSGRRRQIARKRQRQDDDKWEHDLYDDDEPQVSDRRVDPKDLRFKLQRKNIQATQSGKGSLSGGVKDLREKLSGNMHLKPVNTNPPKPKSVLEGSKPARKSVVEAPVPETKGVASSVSRKKTQQKLEGLNFPLGRMPINLFFSEVVDSLFLGVESVDGFLLSLGLEKYAITFQAEEVDMDALVHMSDEDLKAIGIPMGPRKKIRLALESKA